MNLSLPKANDVCLFPMGLWGNSRNLSGILTAQSSFEYSEIKLMEDELLSN